MSHHEIVLSGEYSQYTRLHSFIASFAAIKGYTPSFLDALQLSVKEAFVNAVKHGNREDHALTVTCALSIDGAFLDVYITDCGKGFDPDTVADPLESSNLLKLSGRGLCIIKSVAEIIKVECNEDGSTQMLRYIPY